MKVLNVILSILILLLAAASAVSAYLLWDKRTQMTDGWAKMAAAINKASAAMDRDSGTRIATDLSAASMSHNNYANLDAQLRKFDSQVRKLMEQRNALAEALHVNGVAVELKGLPESGDFTSIEKFEGSKDSVAKGVVDFVKRRNALVSKVGNTAGKLDVGLNARDLKDTPDQGYLPFDTRVDQLCAQLEAYNGALTNMASIAESDRPDFSEAAYAAALVKVTNAVSDLKAQRNAARQQLEGIHNQYEAAKAELAKSNGKILEVTRKLDDKLAEIAKYREALGMKEEIVAWKDGGVESRRAVRGKVTEVNAKYGFIAIDLGSETEVVQQINDAKVLMVNPKLAKGMELCIARDFTDSKAVDLIGKVKLTTVDGKCSIAETVDLVPGRSIEVGDDVFIDAGYPLSPEANK